MGLSVGFWKLALANFVYFFAHYLALPTLPLASLTVGATLGQMGYILTVASVVQVPVTLLLVGPLINRGYQTRLLLVGSLVYAAAGVALLAVSNLQLFMLVGVLTGVSMGFFSSTAMAAIINYVPAARRGESIGIFGSLSTLAISLGPPVAMQLLRVSWTAVFTGITALGLLTAIVVLTLRPTATAAEQPVALPAVGSGPGLRRVIVPAALPGAMVVLALSLMYGILAAYFPKYALDRGIPNPGFFFTYMAGAILTLRLWAGRMADRLPKVRMIAPAMTAMVLALAVLGLPLPIWMIQPLGVVFGLGYGVTFPVAQALMVEVVPPERRGNSMAMFSAAFTIGVGLGPFVTSPAVARWGFPSAFALGSALGLALLLTFLWAHPPQIPTLAAQGD